MISIAALRALAAAGASVEMIISAVEADQQADAALAEAKANAKAERVREQTRLRVAKHRAKGDLTDVTQGNALPSVTSVTPPSPVPSLKAKRSPDPYKNSTPSPYPTPNTSDPDGSSVFRASAPDAAAEAAAPELAPAQVPLPMVVVEADKPERPKRPRKYNWPEDHAERFWVAYPRRKAKADALKALAKVYQADTVPFQSLLDGIEHLITETDPEFYPYPATWLNGHRWEDEPTPFGSSTHVKANRSAHNGARSHPGGSFSNSVATIFAGLTRGTSGG